MGTSTQIAVGIGVIVTSVAILHFYKKFNGKCPFSCNKKKKNVTLTDSSVKHDIKLASKENVSHDTILFRFALPDPAHTLGLPIGQHVQLCAKIDDELVIRSYTPVSGEEDVGHVDFIIKVYRKNVHPKFPDGGKLTQYLESLEKGDTIQMRGPSGRLVYHGNGKFAVKKLRKDPPNMVDVKRVNMIAGGTGITPMLQLVRSITKDKNDKTELRLLFANQTEKDILVRKELEEAAKSHPEQFKLWYTVDTPPEGWQYSSGFVNADMIKSHLLPPSDDTIVVMCGPPPMINYACIPSLDSLGFNKDLVFSY